MQHTHTHTCTPTYVHTTHAFNLFACNPGRSIGRHGCIGITYACNCQHRLHHPGLCCFFMRPVVYIYICGWVGGWVASLFTQVGFRIVPPPCWWVVQVIDMYVQVLSPAQVDHRGGSVGRQTEATWGRCTFSTMPL